MAKVYRKKGSKVAKFSVTLKSCDLSVQAPKRIQQNNPRVNGVNNGSIIPTGGLVEENKKFAKFAKNTVSLLKLWFSLKYQAFEIFCGSGFPAAICTAGLKENRGWKAAPTIKPTPKILKLMRLRGSDRLRKGE